MSFFKNALLFVAISMPFVWCIGQTKLYVHPQAEDYVNTTNTIAILPFQVTMELRPKERERISEEELKEMELETAVSIQKSMYSWFLTRKKRGKFSKEIQDPNRTNNLLKDAGIDRQKLSEIDFVKLGEILEVECVISGVFSAVKPTSVGVGIASWVFLGGSTTTSKTTANINFNDTRQGDLTVNYYKALRSGVVKDKDDLINVLMRKITRRIPYTK
ncbi:MAG: hypothetical protein OXC03_00545 [Flavobacteriaceae bacterium]|nr:hypothetical protein [Flavobacteriaceae bacterium]